MGQAWQTCWKGTITSLGRWAAGRLRASCSWPVKDSLTGEEPHCAVCNNLGMDPHLKDFLGQ